MSNLTTKTNRATVVPLDFGVVTIEGLVFPNGSYGITFAQFMRLVTEGVSDQSQIPDTQKNFNRDLKRGLGEDSSILKEYAGNNSRSQNVLTLGQISQGLRWAERMGSQRAGDILDSFSLCGLDVLFASALGKEVTAQDLAAQIAARNKGKVHRRSLTDALRDHLIRLGKYDTHFGFYFASMTNTIYRLCLGDDAKGLRSKRGLDRRANVRDHLNEADLQKVAYAEETYARALDATGSPEQAEAMVAVLFPSKP